MCPQARQVNLGTGVTQIFITGEEASLEDISVASTEVGLALNKAYAHKNKPMCTRISLCTQEKAKAHLGELSKPFNRFWPVRGFPPPYPLNGKSA